MAETEKDGGPTQGRIERDDLAIANMIRNEINEILARYDVHSDVFERDVRIDATCVMLADAAIARATGEKEPGQ